MARDAIALFLDVPARSFDLSVESILPQYIDLTMRDAGANLVSLTSVRRNASGAAAKNHPRAPLRKAAHPGIVTIVGTPHPTKSIIATPTPTPNLAVSAPFSHDF